MGEISKAELQEGRRLYVVLSLENLCSPHHSFVSALYLQEQWKWSCFQHWGKRREVHANRGLRNMALHHLGTVVVVFNGVYSKLKWIVGLQVEFPLQQHSILISTGPFLMASKY